MAGKGVLSDQFLLKLKLNFMRKIGLTLVALVILLNSCRDNENPVLRDALVAGTDYDSVTTLRDIPTVWQGKKSSILASGTGNAYAKAIAVDGNDYFVTGYENTVNGWLCKVWKNEELLFSIGDGDPTVGYGIAVDGGDIYVAGHNYQPGLSKHYAMLWKNGAADATYLTDGTNQAEAFTVVISGSDIFVGGYDGDQARVWKNGTPMALANSENFRIRGIAISGSDVYAVGECNCFSSIVIRYWKNGVATTLTDGAYEAYGYGIAVSGSDVYVAGVESSSNKRIAKVWKNGVATNLTDGTKNAWATGVAVENGQVYVVGYERTANDIFNYAMLWKNGTATKIGTRRSTAAAIAIQ
jgi:hypothetical protein